MIKKIDPAAGRWERQYQDVKKHRDELLSIIVTLDMIIKRLREELSEATKAGTVYSRERDGINNMVLRLVELESLVDRVPKTGDGVPIYVGLTVWYYGFIGELQKSMVYEYNAYRCDETEVMTVSADKMAGDILYSTPEAAKAAHKKDMDIQEIVKCWLQANGYDGLYHGCDCACNTDDLMPCAEPGYDCTAGYICRCRKSDEYEFFIQGQPCKKCKAAEAAKESQG